MILEWLIAIDVILIIVLSLATKCDWVFYNTPYGTEKVIEEIIGYLAVFLIFFIFAMVSIRNY